MTKPPTMTPRKKRRKRKITDFRQAAADCRAGIAAARAGMHELDERRGAIVAEHEQVERQFMMLL